MLESVYAELGAAEAVLVAPIDLTWDDYLSHPEFIALLANEDLQRGRHITKSVKVQQLSRPVLEILERGPGRATLGRWS